MRLTKQLKAQANNLKFASQIPTAGDFLLRYNAAAQKNLNNHNNETVISNSNDEENNRTDLSDPLVRNFDNSKKSMTNSQRKVPTIIMTSHSEDSFRDDRTCRTPEQYDLREEDEDSLNSASIQDEQIIL